MSSARSSPCLPAPPPTTASTPSRSTPSVCCSAVTCGAASSGDWPSASPGVPTASTSHLAQEGAQGLIRHDAGPCVGGAAAVLEVVAGNERKRKELDGDERCDRIAEEIIGTEASDGHANQPHMP